jgi:hypothetical protein
LQKIASLPLKAMKEVNIGQVSVMLTSNAESMSKALFFHFPLIVKFFP